MTNNVISIFGANNQLVSSEVEQPRIINPFNQDEAHSQVSTRYHQVNTSEVTNILTGNGWEIKKTASARVRSADRQGYQKHYAWLSPKGINNQLEVGDTEMRLMITNSHDGTSAVRLEAGLHRLVCSNGLAIGIGDFEYISIRHTSENIEELVIDGALKIAAMAPQIDEMIKKMRNITLTAHQQAEFAASVTKAVWPNKELGLVDQSGLLISRREADKDDSLWTTYNKVQESVVRGGISAGARRTRSITSPVRDVEVNKMIFAIAVDAMKKAA